MAAHRLWIESGASGRAVNLYHTTIENDRDENGHDFETQADKQRFYGQAKQFADAHSLHTGSHLIQRCLNINACAAVDNPGCPGYDILPDVKDRHHDVEGISHEVDCHSRLEKPLEEHPCVHVR